MKFINIERSATSSTALGIKDWADYEMSKEFITKRLTTDLNGTAHNCHAHSVRSHSVHTDWSVITLLITQLNLN
jgi:hypothetical protein